MFHYLKSISKFRIFGKYDSSFDLSANAKSFITEQKRL